MSVPDVLIEVTARNQDMTMCDAWTKSKQASAVLDDIEQISEGESASSSSTKRQAATYASSTIQQSILLSRRTLLQYWRTPDYVYSRLYCSFLHASLNGLVFLQLSNSVASLQYRIFSCFMVLMIVPEFISASASMFVDNRNIWLGREYPSRTFGWFAFSTAQLIAEIPYALAGGVIFYVLFYFLVGLPLGTPAGYVFLMMCMFHLFSTSWGQWIAALRYVSVSCSSILALLTFSEQCRCCNGSELDAIFYYRLRTFQRCSAATSSYACRMGIHNVLHRAIHILDLWNRSHDSPRDCCAVSTI